jgi:ATP-dependent Clp protease ATP-binding subunit ClpA
MFERFTDRARKVMALANQLAQVHNHEYIGTEHILLGLVKEGSGVGANVLRNLDVDLRKVRLEVEKLVKSGPDLVTMGRLPQTPRAKKAVEFAIEEARNLDHNYVGTEHLLLGLLREHDGVAGQVLMYFGLRIEEVREEVIAVLSFWSEEKKALANIKEEIERLNVRKGEAIGNQSYEEAAKLRDQAEILRTKLGVIQSMAGRMPDLALGVKEDAARRLEGRFTDRARKAVAMASEEAKRFNHEYVGTEHILLGILKEDGGVGAKVLKSLGVEFEGVRLEAEKLVKRGDSVVDADQLPQTPRAKQVIKFAIEEAGLLIHNYVGTEHILLGVLREQDGVGSRILMNLGLKLDQVREEVLKKVALEAANNVDRKEALVSYLGMFLGWLNNPYDPVARILLEMNVDLDEFRRRVKRLMDDNQRPH